MDPNKLKVTIEEVRLAADTILEILEQVDPQVAPEAALAEQIANLTARLASTAITAYSTAANQAITLETIEALRADPTPLPAPTL